MMSRPFVTVHLDELMRGFAIACAGVLFVSCVWSLRLMSFSLSYAGRRGAGWVRGKSFWP